MEEGNSSQKLFLIKAGIIVGSGGLIFGYDIGVIAGTLSKLGSTFNLSSYEEGLVVAILYVGSILGSVVGGPMCDYLGRWKTIHIQNILFCIGSFVTGFATNLTMLCIGRFIVGIASAVSGIADVPYLNEISPPEYRGVLSSQYEMAVSIGVLISFAVALGLSGLEYGWRVAFLLPSILAILQSCGMVLLPESPRWLLEKGLLEKTRSALSCIYGSEFLTHCSCLEREHNDVPVEVRDYLRACDKEGKLTALAAAMEKDTDFEVGAMLVPPNKTYNVSGSSFNMDTAGSAATVGSRQQQHHSHSSAISGSAALRAMFLQEKQLLQQYQYPIYLIVVIQVLAQITGGNVIRNYAPTIFEDGGVSHTMSLVYNLLFGVVKTIFTFVSITSIDQTGRLKLLVYGIVLVGGGMTFLSICSLTSASGNISNVPAFVVGCALVYAGFGLGYGPVPWVLSAEMFPTLIRGRIMSISLIASNIAQLVVNFLFLPMTEGVTTAGTFFIFVALNIITFFFVKKFLVETKEIAPEEILRDLLGRYRHSASKLVTLHPILAPAVACCCCVREEDLMDINEAITPSVGEASGKSCGGSPYSAEEEGTLRLTSGSPGSGKAPKMPSYQSVATAQTNASGSASSTAMNPLVTSSHIAGDTNTTAGSSSVGHSRSLLTGIGAAATEGDGKNSRGFKGEV